MAISEKLGQAISRMYYAIRDEAELWRKTHLPEMRRLREERVIAEKELRQRLEMMDIRFKEECDRARMEEERQTRHFGEFLDSIDEMKDNMLAYYATMPKPIALMIHHHAAELLKEAWRGNDAMERLRKQTRFTELMLTITEDLSELNRSAEPKALPEKTIAFIQNQD